jgi:uncharacterized protein (TIGR02147 family)
MAAVVEGTPPDLYAFSDYREYLRCHYEHRRLRQPSFSYRFMSSRLEIDPGQLSRILQGKLHLPQRALAATLKLCRFDPREAAYFEELVRLGRSRKPEEIIRSRERLEALRSVTSRELSARSEGFYGHWRHAVIRALVGFVDESGDGRDLGTLCLPAQSGEEAAASIRLLEETGLVVRDQEGRLRPADPHVVPGDGVSRAALRRWHGQSLDLAVQSLERFGPDRRDVSTLTVALSSKDLGIVRGWIADLRRQVKALAGAADSPSQVVDVCVQVFPVARTSRSGGL